MDANEIAAAANVAGYSAEGVEEYVEGAPHLKHASLRAMYVALVADVYRAASADATSPHVLDLGAGEGSATLPFLELGAKVTAVDISSHQLDVLRAKCAGFEERLEVRCENIESALQVADTRYDVIVANSFLHHIPDYLGLISSALALLSPFGVFFSFQDPLRYDTMGAFSRMFSSAAYFSWRVQRGDVVAGLRRRLRRSRGVYLENSMHDNVEYHVTRNGVDQSAIGQLFAARGFDCRIVRYFSTQSYLFQPVGAAIGVENTFGVIAQPVKPDAKKGEKVLVSPHPLL